MARKKNSESDGVKEASPAYQPPPLRKLNVTDAKGRINLGIAFANKFWKVSQKEDGSLILTPMVAVPEREIWFYKNAEAQAMVQEGIRQSLAGKGEYLGSFAEYLDIDIDEEYEE